jgi:DNA topoisomerase-1
MIDFGERLPRIRQRIDSDLAGPVLSREKVLAAVVRLLDRTFLRIGNEEYARLNESFGLTTLRNRHAHVRGNEIRFRFRGKSGKEHNVGLRDRRLARVIRRLQELPGQELFTWVDGDGSVHEVSSGDVNDYLRDISGADVTAKDFRTWAGTVLAFRALCSAAPAASETAAKSTVVAAIRSVAERLGNTPAVCRKSYVHPGVLEAYMSGELPQRALAAAEEDADVAPPGDDPDEEAAVLRLLRAQLETASTAVRSAA